MKNIHLSFIFGFFVAVFGVAPVAEGRGAFYGMGQQKTFYATKYENGIDAPFLSYVGSRHGVNHFKFVYHVNRGFKHDYKDHSRSRGRGYKDGYRDGYRAYKKGYKNGYRDGYRANKRGFKHGYGERSRAYRRHHRGHGRIIYGYGFGYRYRH